MKIQKILLLCLLMQGVSLQATIIAAWNGKLFLRAIDGVVVIATKIQDATNFVIRPTEDPNWASITNEDQSACLYYDRMRAQVLFGCARDNKHLFGVLLEGSPFSLITDDNNFLRLGIEGKLELNYRRDQRILWQFID